MTVLAQIEVVEEEFWSNARMKRKQAEVLVVSQFAPAGWPSKMAAIIR